MSGMLHGKYMGPDDELHLECALLREAPDDQFWVQFDGIEYLPEELTHGWHLRPRAHFELDPPTDWEEHDRLIGNPYPELHDEGCP